MDAIPLTSFIDIWFAAVTVRVILISVIGMTAIIKYGGNLGEKAIHGFPWRILSIRCIQGV